MSYSEQKQMEDSDSKEPLYDSSSVGGPLDVNGGIIEDIPVSLDVSSIPIIVQPSLRDLVFNYTVEVTSSLIAGIGLPNSGKTSVLEGAFKKFINLKLNAKLNLDYYLRRKKNEQCLTIYELCALGGPPHDEFAWSFATRHYGAIYSIIHILAHRRKDLDLNSILASPITDHPQIDKHIHWLLGKAYSQLESIEGNNESLKLTLIQDGLALLNVMDFGVNKALHGLLPIMLSICRRNIRLVFFSLDNDVSDFERNPDLLDPKYVERQDKDTAMSQRLRLKQLLHFATLGHKRSQKRSVPFIATTKENASSAQAEVTIKSQMVKFGLIPEIIHVNLEDENSVLGFGENMQEFIKYQYKERTIDIPFRSMLFRSYLASLIQQKSTIIFDKSFITKEAKWLNIDIEDFLEIFTDFGSILYIDVPQFESLREFVIIDVWKFTEYLNELYYPNPSEPHAKDLYAFGIVSEQSVRGVLLSEKNVSRFMQILTEFGMAVTIESGSSIIVEQETLDPDQQYYFLPVARIGNAKSIPLREDGYVFFEIDDIASPPDVLAGITEELMKNKEVFMFGTTEHNVSRFQFRSKNEYEMEIVCEGDKVKLKVNDINEDTFSSAVEVCEKFLKACVSFLKRYNDAILNFQYAFAIPCFMVSGSHQHYYGEGDSKESMLCNHCSSISYKKCWSDAAQKCQHLKHEGYKTSEGATELQVKFRQLHEYRERQNSLQTANEKFQTKIEELKRIIDDQNMHIARLKRRSGDQIHDKTDFDFDKASKNIDNLNGVQIIQKEYFSVENDEHCSINWQKYGLSIEIHKGSLLPSMTAEVAVKVFIGGSFVFPKNFVLVSAVYAISVSEPLLKPLSLSLQHCIDLKNHPTLTNYLKFATVPITVPAPNVPYQFSLMEGGNFSGISTYGVIDHEKLRFLVCIVGYSEEEAIADIDDNDDYSMEDDGGEDASNGEGGEGAGNGEEGEGAGNGEGEGASNGDVEGSGEEGEGGDGDREGSSGASESSVTAGSSSHADPISDKSSNGSPVEKHHCDDDPKQPAALKKAKKYAIVIFDEESRKKVRIAATKQLNALLEHIKRLYNVVDLNSTTFYFKSGCASIELVFDDSKQDPEFFKGWRVQPCIKPCKVMLYLYFFIPYQ
ncbi:PREDICTED: uncharacterized protein LOC109582895 isoform X2 [Amphimedon queenslandica]|uniref:Uncharacterized protein n=1 Tax=Amphimedon queenslandica TaxID=400682 RepID=A0AAN0JA22_AMPQE|nr:PREDICTED: uncharacterized protein LOC109582895 isoform X2 [Amphimedon queenslandica]|eukprot:XP_019853576.1 PREDICTED: uncharacterized protein LOC109582895 isoform X2 [Amphimedon queenslandica]